MSAAAPRPPKRASPTPGAACWRMPPRPAWFSRFRRNHQRERDPKTAVNSGQHARRRMMMSVVSDDTQPLTFTFEDDGIVPNNPLPFLVYKGAIDVDNGHPEKTIEGLFGANGWGDMWRNGVYDYLHYHATVHEALGIARGHALIRFGGDRGKEIEIAAAMSPSSPPAPGISAFPRAGISA